MIRVSCRWPITGDTFFCRVRRDSVYLTFKRDTLRQVCLRVWTVHLAMTVCRAWGHYDCDNLRMCKRWVEESWVTFSQSWFAQVVEHLARPRVQREVIGTLQVTGHAEVPHKDLYTAHARWAHVLRHRHVLVIKRSLRWPSHVTDGLRRVVKTRNFVKL